METAAENIDLESIPTEIKDSTEKEAEIDENN